MDVGQGLGAAGADSRRLRLDGARPSRGKCTTLSPPPLELTTLAYCTDNLVRVACIKKLVYARYSASIDNVFTAVLYVDLPQVGCERGNVIFNLFTFHPNLISCLGV